MLSRPSLVRVLACLSMAACSSPSSPPSDGGPPDAAEPDAGPCAEEASLYCIDIDEKKQALVKGSELPVTLGFQGFQYVRVGLRSPLALPATVTLWAHVLVEGKADVTTPFAGIETHAIEGGVVESGELSFMLNDVPLSDLLGQPATVELWTTAPGCVLRGAVEVTLVQGAFEGPDGGSGGGDGGGI
jgi:hypothetical protein